jgi:hypothetical protein
VFKVFETPNKFTTPYPKVFEKGDFQPGNKSNNIFIEKNINTHGTRPHVKTDDICAVPHKSLDAKNVKNT